MTKYFVLLIFLIVSCGTSKEKDPKPDDRMSEVLTVFESEYQEAMGLIGLDGWITSYSCDGMIWSAKLGSIRRNDSFDVEAAEGESGRFYRRPSQDCVDEEESATSWSRDMGIAGLIPYAYLKKDLAILERHRNYGKSHYWKMGEPLDDGRVLYTPQTIGLLYETIYVLGGDDSVNRHWPSVYPPNLTDYHAHLQVMQIWLRGEIDTSLNLMNIRHTMFERLQEHAKRSPDTLLYQYVLGKYTGDQNATISLILDPNKPSGEYVRCDPYSKEICGLAERLFVTDLLLRDFGM